MAPSISAMSPSLFEIQIADEPDAWRRAGFCVVDQGVVRLSGVNLRLTGKQPNQAGITGWTFASVDSIGAPPLVDGIPTSWVAPESDTPGNCSIQDEAPHSNGAVHLDHVVMTTRNIARSIEALQAAGFELRRIRDIAPNQQAFFWAGDSIIELVGPARTSEARPEAEPANLWGLAISSRDLQASAASLGAGLSEIKGAVQKGRQIATLRSKNFAISVPVVLMSPHESV